MERSGGRSPTGGGNDHEIQMGLMMMLKMIINMFSL